MKREILSTITNSRFSLDERNASTFERSFVARENDAIFYDKNDRVYPSSFLDCDLSYTISFFKIRAIA